MTSGPAAWANRIWRKLKLAGALMRRRSPLALPGRIGRPTRTEETKERETNIPGYMIKEDNASANALQHLSLRLMFNRVSFSLARITIMRRFFGRGLLCAICGLSLCAMSGCEPKQGVIGESGEMTFEKYEELQRQSSSGMTEMPKGATQPPPDAKKK